MLLWRPSKDVAERLASIQASGTAPMALPQYLLDGQQRLTSLHRVFNRHQDADVVFNVEEERFQIQSAATGKDARWVRVVDVLTTEKLSVVRRAICLAQPHLDQDIIDEHLGRSCLRVGHRRQPHYCRAASGPVAASRRGGRAVGG